MRSVYGLILPGEQRKDGSMIGEIAGWRLASDERVKVYFPRESIIPGRKVCEFAMKSAENVLAVEIEGRTTVVQREELEKIFGVKVFWKPLAQRFLTSLTEPPLGMIPTLNESLSESELFTRTQLFWRCLVGLIASPMSRLQMMAKRRGANPSFQKDESEMERKLKYMKFVLPWFAMVAKACPTPSPALKRRTSTQQTKVSTSQPISKETSAAKHTYDVGYKKWQNFEDEEVKERELDTELTAKLQNASPEVREELSKLKIYENLLNKKKEKSKKLRESDTQKIQSWKSRVLKEWKENPKSKYRRQFRSQEEFEEWIEKQTTKALQRKYPSEREKESIRQMEEID